MCIRHLGCVHKNSIHKPICSCRVLVLAGDAREVIVGLVAKNVDLLVCLAKYFCEWFFRLWVLEAWG